MARERHILPLSPRVRDDVEHELHDVHDESLRYRIRRLAERAYGDGYEDGHLAGGREVDADRRAERDAVIKAQRKAAAGG